MYDFHYNFIKKHSKAGLLFTDTDSLTYEINSDVYEEFLSTNICLTLVTIQKVQSFLIRLIKKLLVKWKTSRMKKNWWVCWIKVKDVFHEKISMVKNLMQSKEWILQLSLINLKTLYLTQK